MSLRSTIICFASIVNNAQTLDCSVQQFTLKTLQSPSLLLYKHALVHFHGGGWFFVGLKLL